MSIITCFAASLQNLLGSVAQEIADRHHLIVRHRKFTATSLLSMFVLGYWHKPTASVADLAATAAQLGIDVSPQAVAKRFQPHLRDALHDLLQHTLTRMVAAQPRSLPLVQSFPAVIVGDSTTITLRPALAERYPGCGGKGNSGAAALKIQVQWDLTSGAFVAALEKGRQSDATSPLLDAEIPTGSLVLRDLGYFSLERFAPFNADKIFWISRGSSNLTVQIDDTKRDLVHWLSQQNGDRIDRPVRVGAIGLACRLVALRVPPAIAKKRRAAAIKAASKQCRVARARRLAACDWTIILTNLPADSFDADTIFILYRVRWQIELLFKLWKSHHHLAQHRHDDPVQQMIELFARLIAVIRQHQVILATGWRNTRLSFVKAARVIREQLPRIVAALRDRAALEAMLQQLVILIAKCQLTLRRHHPGTNQTLQKQAKTP